MALAGFQWVNELANNCILVAILSYGGHLVLSGRMTPDQMYFKLYIFKLYFFQACIYVISTTTWREFLYVK